MLESVVDLRSVTRRFGKKTALDRVSLEIPSGSVLGLVGENGAGKTTLIRHVLGLLRPDEGTVRVFGRDPVADPVGVLSSVGYLSEDADLPGWMRVRDLMRYCRAFYPAWDDRYAEELRREFGLDPSAVIRTLSRGQRARAGLMAALAHRPHLLVLDEPSSGLDPVVRRDILTAIIRTIADEGRTVLFSSHLLSEVERVSDRVAMIRGGRILFSSPVEEIRESHCRVTLRFDGPRSDPPRLDGVVTWDGAGTEWTAFCAASIGQVEAAAAMAGARVVDRSRPSLDEIFMARAAEPAGRGEP
jgi:ABC-2 type transport system ATP-binding protein